MLKSKNVMGRFIFILPFVISFYASADDFTVRLTGSVFEDTCVINGNKDIVVDFGSNILERKIDGSNYREKIEYTMDCGSPASNAMRLKIQGAQSGFDTTLVATERADLGIALKNDAADLPVDTWVNFTYPNLPNLYAVPVKQAGSTLNPGKFIGAATLVVEFI